MKPRLVPPPGNGGRPGSGRFRVGEFIVEPSLNQLTCGRRTLSVEPKVMEVLVCLAGRAGEVVTKEELLAEVWPGSAVSDEAIWHAISQLRRVLGDDSRSARFIHTVPKRGYRLIAPTGTVRRPRQAAEGSVSRVSRRGAFRRRFRDLVLGATAAAAAAAAVAWLRWPAELPARVFLVERPLTGRTGSAPLSSCALAPDGRYLACSDRRRLWVQLVTGGQALQLPTPQVDSIRDLTWLPDGAGLVFAGRVETDTALLSISIYGERPRIITTGGEAPSVSPDGRRLVFLRRSGSEVWVCGVDGSRPTLVAGHTRDRFGDPAWSPDGGRIAYWRSHGPSLRHSIEVLDPESGDRREVYSDIEEADLKWRALFWSASGSLFLSYPRLTPQFGATLWELDPGSGGAPRLVYHFADSFPSELSASKAGRIAVLKTSIQSDLSLGTFEEGRLVKQQQLTSDSFFDWPTGWNRDGSGVFFHSNRRGEWDIFEQLVDGSSPRRLTDLPGSELWPRLSRDGRWILFWTHSTRRLVPDAEVLMGVPVDGGVGRRVLELPGATSRFDCPIGGSRPCVLSRQRPGTVVFSAFDLDEGLGEELARLPEEAGPRGHAWDLSDDGRRIVLIAGAAASELRVLDLDRGGLVSLQAPAGQRFFAASWNADGQAIYAAIGPSYLEQRLALVTLDGRTVSLLAEDNGESWYSEPRAAPNGRSVLYAELSLRSNAWLLEPGG